MTTCLILGGGIAGLSLAYQLQKKIKNLTLLEGSNRLGGWIRSDASSGFLFEKGPRSLRLTGPGQNTLALAKELELEEEIIFSKGSARYLWTQGKLQRFPSNPLQMLTSPLMRGVFSALWKERKIPPSSLEDETIESFFLRRFNQTVLDRFVDPLVTGIWAGSCKELSMRACFPKLKEMEKHTGSLIRGMRKKKRGNHGLFSFKQGMETLPKRLTERLEIEVKLNHLVTSITCYPDHVEVVAGGNTFCADHVFCALPAHILTELIDVPTVTPHSKWVVNLGYHKLRIPKEGFGYLIPSKEEETILGAVWDSSVFPQQNKSDDLRITVMMDRPDVEVAKEALARQMGIEKEPDASSLFFAEKALPQYTLGHTERVSEMEKSLHKRLTVLGSSYYGVSVNDCVKKSLALSDGWHPLGDPHGDILARAEVKVLSR